ncbi:MAG TPA: type II toxin-antitoxin system prevent-host-death family antitoxin [Verrucomicrobiae bacterium]|nr:type II toxin-antitoxin system prevent-host-death family antitoxin [Verrucomicrobiae bacterium]
MLHVDLDNILTHDELGSKAEEILRKADEEGKILVVTRNGRPAVAILKIEQLEELSGKTVSPATPTPNLAGFGADADAAPAAPLVNTPNPAMQGVPGQSQPQPAPEMPAPMAPPSMGTPNPDGLPDMPA